MLRDGVYLVPVQLQYPPLVHGFTGTCKGLSHLARPSFELSRFGSCYLFAPDAYGVAFGSLRLGLELRALFELGRQQHVLALSLQYLA